MDNTKNTAPVVNADEFAVAEKEAQESKNTYTHTFATPFTYEGQTYHELVFDWGRLTGHDSLMIENELTALGKTVIAPEFSGEYLMRMAARACTSKIGWDTLAAMPLADFNRIRNRARSFLLRSGR